MKKVWLLILGAIAAGLSGCYEIYTGAISVSSEPAGAEVYLDDSLTGSVTDCMLEDIIVGQHTVELSLEGFLDYADSVEVIHDDTVQFTAVFDTAASLVVITDPQGADVYLNDSLTGEKTNCTLTGLPAGEYSVRLTLEGYKDLVDSCNLRPGEIDTVSGYFLTELEILWTYTCPYEILYQVNPALGHDGTVYFCATDYSSCFLYAVDGEGNFKWKITIQGGSYDTPPSDPAIADDGSIYIGTESNICAYTSNGQFKWRYTTGDYPASGKHPAPAIGSDGTVYHGSWDGHLYAFTPGGDTLWTYNAVKPISSSPCIGPDNTVYFTTDEYLFAFSPDGEMKWSIPIEPYISPIVIGPDGTLYFGSTNSSTFYAYRSDMFLKWSLELMSRVRYSPAVGPDGTIYVNCFGDYAYALNPDGTLKWVFYIPEDGVPSSPTVDSEGNIIFGASDAVYTLKSDGSLKWKSDIGEDGTSAPLIAPDGTIYIVSEDNCLYAIKGEAGLATSSWPRARANNQNTGRAR